MAWSKKTQGLVLGSYFWGYLLTQVPAGYLAGRFGARFIYGGAIFMSSVVTLFLPMSAGVHWMLFAGLQILVGTAHGAIWPCLSVIGAHWAPLHERGKLMSIMNVGAQVGNVLILSTGGFMCSGSVLGGWPLIFYSTGKCLSCVEWRFDKGFNCLSRRFCWSAVERDVDLVLPKLAEEASVY